MQEERQNAWKQELMQAEKQVKKAERLHRQGNATDDELDKKRRKLEFVKNQSKAWDQNMERRNAERNAEYWDD